ncbi:aminoglycoside nucleotidyltransferase ANT(9) [Virgibacillus flavescens]|uniref:aminoglycoside nucleotidyltransferase ANT(9) n=1 Tax=Virgibacillus flavescens TaxID=1611422 RepID=UPI003D331B78
MRNLNNEKVPKEAIQALKVVKEVLGSTVVGVFLYGSAVNGGLRINSDVDVLVVVNHRLSEVTRRNLTENLMLISGKVNSMRPLEVTVINKGDVVPWRYPPRNEYLYGEWLRNEFENGQFPEPYDNPDLAIVLAQARKNNISLFGPDASDILDPVPMVDIRRAILDSVPELMDDTKGDERNVILTLARMWQTMEIGEITPKDVAAEWAIPRLPNEHATLLDIARKAYRGECTDKWDGLDTEVNELVTYMKNAIES